MNSSLIPTHYAGEFAPAVMKNYTTIDACINWYMNNHIKMGWTPVIWTLWIFVLYGLGRVFMKEDKRVNLPNEKSIWVSEIFHVLMYMSLIVMFFHMFFMVMTQLPQW